MAPSDTTGSALQLAAAALGDALAGADSDTRTAPIA
jgi:hypothetical protein